MEVPRLRDEGPGELTEGVGVFQRCPITEENFLPFFGTLLLLVVEAATSDASFVTPSFNEAAA